MIRVLHLRDTTRLCGPGKTILETVRLNPDPDIEYEVAAFGTPESNAYLGRMKDDCATVGMPKSRALLPRTAFQLARHVRDHGISIIHSHDFKTRALAALMKPFTKEVFVTTAHGHVTTNLKSRLRNGADNALLRRNDTVLAVSEAMRTELRGSGVAKAKIEVVRNCIVLGNYPFGYRSGALKARLDLPDGSKVVGCVGRLSREKGQMGLLKAFPQILEAKPDARLVFVGEGPDDARLRAEANRLGLGDIVCFLGHIDDVLEVLGGLDLLVLNSRSEGLPNVVLEAMAVGVPVIANAVGGVPELVTDGVTGVLVNPMRPAQMVDGILSALRSRPESETRARAARTLVEQEFEMSQLIRRTHGIYRRVLGHRHLAAEPV